MQLAVGVPDGSRSRANLSNVTSLCFLKAVAACSAACRALGLPDGVLPGDVGVRALQVLGIQYDALRQLAWLHPDSLLANGLADSPASGLLQRMQAAAAQRLAEAELKSRRLEGELSGLRAAAHKKLGELTIQLEQEKQARAAFVRQLGGVNTGVQATIDFMTARIAKLEAEKVVLEQKVDRMAEDIQELRDRAEDHRTGKKAASRSLQAAEGLTGSLLEHYTLTSAETTTRFIKLLKANPPPPDTQSYLAMLVENQLSVYASSSHRCRLWHREVLDWCGHVMRCSKPAYQAMSFGGVLQLPHERTVEKHIGKAYSEAGHSTRLYEGVGESAKGLSDQDRRTCALIFDEINVVGDLAFKILNGEYTFYGLVSDEIRAALFIPPKGDSDEEKLKAKQATHALVFQVTSLSGAKFRRVCGIHPVAALTAAILDQLFWETVNNLQVHSGVTIVAAVCDGAGCNRLFQKMQTSNLRKGSPNTFVRSWCPNKVSDDDKARIFFLSDPSHLIKKYCNHFEKSRTFFARVSRSLLLPDFLVQLVLRPHEPAPPPAAGIRGTSTGEECFMRVFGRLYDLMASSFSPPYYHGKDPLDRPDARITELQDILQFVRCWHDFNEEQFKAPVSAKERSSHFLSHQLYFDTQMMIDGFLELLTYLEARDGVIRIIARKLNQDSLESLFGQLRFNCGSGRDPSIFKAVHALPRVEEQRLIRRAVRYRQKLNSGQAGSSAPVGGGGTAWLDGHRVRLPADLAARCATAKAALPHGPSSHPVHWQTLRDFQAKDEARAKRHGNRNVPWLTASQHINKTGFSRMKVGLAVAVVSIRTANMMLLDRLGLIRWQ